jgi:hypothetical protein
MPIIHSPTILSTLPTIQIFGDLIVKRNTTRGLYLVFKDNKLCVDGQTGKEGDVLTAPDGSPIAADLLCCIRPKNPRPSKLYICNCVYM